MATFATAVLVIFAVAVSGAVYLLPTFVGWARRVPHLGSVAVVNVLLGWTLAGWVVALAMALRSAATAGPVIQVVQNLPPGPMAGPPHLPGQPPQIGPPPRQAPGWSTPPYGPVTPSRHAGSAQPATPPARPASQAPPLILPPHAGQPREQSHDSSEFRQPDHPDRG